MTLTLEETDDDLEIAIRAMSQTVALMELEKLSVIIEENKFENYLRTHKLGKLLCTSRSRMASASVGLAG